MALISRKRQKVAAILGEPGDGATPEAFAGLFRERHPGDWERVVAKWEQVLTSGQFSLSRVGLN